MKSSLYFWLALLRTKRRWRFRKILWPSQNIWTLTIKLKCSIGIKTKLKLKAEIWKKSYFPSEIIWPHLVCRSRVFVPFTGGGGEDDSSHFQFESIRSTIVNFSLSKILDCQTWFQFLAVWLAKPAQHCMCTGLLSVCVLLN